METQVEETSRQHDGNARARQARAHLDAVISWERGWEIGTPRFQSIRRARAALRSYMHSARASEAAARADLEWMLTREPAGEPLIPSDGPYVYGEVAITTARSRLAEAEGLLRHARLMEKIIVGVVDPECSAWHAAKAIELVEASGHKVLHAWVKIHGDRHAWVDIDATTDDGLDHREVTYLPGDVIAEDDALRQALRAALEGA